MIHRLKGLVALFSFSILFFSSCAVRKDIVLFGDIQEGATNNVFFALPMIQINDILDIKITTLNPVTALPYNSGMISMGVPSMELLQLQGYLVSAEGKIMLPILGALPAKGKTTAILEKEIVLQLENGGHLVKPTVTVRILNAKVTVLGEVKKPGTYNYTEQTITLPQALGYAGDITIEANRKEVWLIREEDGTRKYHKLDLTKSDWLKSLYYNIKQNDVIYVTPNNVKVKSAGFIGNTSTVLSVISILLTTYVLLTR